MTDAPASDPTANEPDPLDVEAAEIDARSPDAAEQIEELIEHAAADGKRPTQPVDPTASP